MPAQQRRLFSFADLTERCAMGRVLLMPSDAAPYLETSTHPRPRRTFREAFTKSCADRARIFGTASLGRAASTQAVRGIRLARAVHQARIAQAVRFLDPTAHHALARHGLDVPRGAGTRRDVSLGGAVVATCLTAAGTWALVAALDNDIPLAAAASMAGAL
jgi:hypothetical protein